MQGKPMVLHHFYSPGGYPRAPSVTATTPLPGTFAADVSTFDLELGAHIQHSMDPNMAS